MKLASVGSFLVWFLIFLPHPIQASPVIPGLAVKTPLNDAEVGDILLVELRCLACHSWQTNTSPGERLAPDLGQVGSRIAPEYLKRLIASPTTVHADSSMPDLLTHESQESRERIADAISQFLISQSVQPFKREIPEDKDIVAGKNLFHGVGCVACHSPRDENAKEISQKGVVGQGHVAAKYSLASLSEFLYQPLKIRPAGRMPDMKLTPAEARAIASYLIGKTKDTSNHGPAPTNLINQGKQYFRELNCVACHSFSEWKPAPHRPLDLGKLDRGCLSNIPGKNPQYSLSDNQVKAIRASLNRKFEPLTDKSKINSTLIVFNCIACHVRDDWGGVSPEINLLFQTSEKGLGDEARIPPPLTLVGAKLKPVALKKMLFDGDSVRSYMFTRMPQFGEPNIRHLPELFAKVDTIKPIHFKLPNPESEDEKERNREPIVRKAGQELLGDKALNCIACHRFNGKSVTQKGIDLMTIPQRLNEGWYYQYMIDPNKFRPRTVMPTSWPGGKAIMQTVLHGDTDQQLEAIWYYLTLGTSAADPSGLRHVNTAIVVDTATRTYRGRSTVAGYRGIAVGFPQKLNYAFNAETGTISAFWSGPFINVDRGGQGSGGFNPAARAIQLAQDLSFFDLPDENSPWPLRPVMTKEAPVNPDPLYPKNRGYQFRGYQTDDSSIPTFFYRSGKIEIADRTEPTNNGKKALVRTLTFESPENKTLWFRALTGKIVTESQQQYRISGLRLEIPMTPVLLRPGGNEKIGSELLLKLEIPKGQSTRVLTYAIYPE